MNVQKLLYAIIFLVTMNSIFLHADTIRGEYATQNTTGQEYYMNRCSSCHGDGARGGNMASVREWKQLFSNNASELLELHLDDTSTIKVVEYFKSDVFKKESKLMLQLLQEFAYDSDNIPTCN